ncbi:MAG: metallophosphoesterase [Candidatus Eisenbacteria bacterium]|nr:metallophosphoesterase [Candidatus Eisenbacteria bacterium]
MALARFLQVSDLHLGKPFAWLPADRREDRRRDQQRALEQAIAQAIERGAHAILVPGDLFDSVNVEAGLLTFAVKAFAVAGCPPVFISPGNHDPASATNAAWSQRLLQARGIAWPAHVHVFDTPSWTAATVPRLQGVRVWGRGFAANVESAERPLAKEALREVTGTNPLGFEIAVFHGSREGFCPPGQKVTAPFSDPEIAASPFVYHAVGHYHTLQRLEQPLAEGVNSAGARLAYAGSGVSLDLTETGIHGALEVRIEYGHRMPFIEVEPIELDRRRVYDLNVDVTGSASADAIDRRVLKALDLAGAGELDLVTVRIAGRLSAGVRWSGPGSDLRDRTFHGRFDTTGVRPDYDLASYRGSEAKTTEERFARELLSRMDAESDPARRAMLERALYHGLDAFKLREVAPAWDEVAK